jgi:DNA-binding CsgD family transcriptional regulator
VPAALFERAAELAVLDAALHAAAERAGSAVLVSGEAGIGKTSLVRAFVRSVAGHGRTLVGSCDDLFTPRPLGPLRDAAADSATISRALALDDPDSVLQAVVDELAGPGGPTVLVVEDAHWADEASVDVLGYVSRRIATLPAVLVVTYRDGEIARDHPLLRVLGGLTGAAVHRLPLRPLSRKSVSQWAGGTTVTSAPLYRLTGGNPFFLSEVLAAPGGAVPATVVDAVLARVRRLPPATVSALQQLSVVPSRTQLPLARALLGDLTVLADAERVGLVEVSPTAIGFRHELARRAVEDDLPGTQRMGRHQAVLEVLLADDTTDLARVVHHAVRSGNDAAVARHAPEAARRACRAGAQAQGAELYEQALAFAALLPAAEHADILEAYAWALFTLGRLAEAVAAARDAVAARERLGDRPGAGRALVAQSLHQWAALDPGGALSAARQAERMLADGADPAGHALALTQLGIVLTLQDDLDAGRAALEAGVAAADQLGDPDLVALARLYRGRGLLLAGAADGLTDLLAAVAHGVAHGQHELVLRAYVNLVEALWTLGRQADTATYLEEAARYAADRDYRIHLSVLDAYRYRLRAATGDWATAEAGLRGLVGDLDDPRPVRRHSLGPWARLLVQLGHPEAGPVLDAAVEHARRADSLTTLLPTTLAVLEQARWSGTGDGPAAAEPVLARLSGPGRERQRGPLLVALRRLGADVTAFAGCPDPHAASLSGDWAAAAAAWERIGDPYERALCLLDSGAVEPTLTALAVFDELGARPAAATSRHRLRGLGVTRIPRGPQSSTRSNPAGLTDRQVEILAALADGHTNAEIAARLVLSTRTVDHHVSAVLQRIGASNRREAAAMAAELGITQAG